MHAINLVLYSPSLQPRVQRLLVRRGSRALRRRRNPLAEGLLGPTETPNAEPSAAPSTSSPLTEHYRHLVPVQFLCVLMFVLAGSLLPLWWNDNLLVNETRGDAVAIVGDRVVVRSSRHPYLFL
jgi:hypothetical protein